MLIAVSALPINRVKKKLDDCGFDHFLTKPADVEKRLAIVDQSTH